MKEELKQRGKMSFRLLRIGKREKLNTMLVSSMDSKNKLYPRFDLRNEEDPKHNHCHSTVARPCCFYAFFCDRVHSSSLHTPGTSEFSVASIPAPKQRYCLFDLYLKARMA